MKWWLIPAGIAGAALLMRNKATLVVDDKVKRLADAIAYAEGYFAGSNTRPNRNNNPGDLERDVTGAAIGSDGPYVVYGSVADGWAALWHQVSLMLYGGSSIYSSGMTIREMASHYTATEQNIWAANVAARLGVSVDTKLSEV